MKRLKLLSYFVILFMAIGFTSCDVEPIDPALTGEDPNSNAPAAFQVDFNGSTYEASTAQASVLNGSIVLTAIKSDGSTFMITVPGTTVGTYTNATIMYTPAITSGGNFYVNSDDSGTNGTVNITSINTTTHKITGTFSFTGIYTGDGQPNIVFTNGIFTNITYTGTIAEPSTGTFTVSAGGTTFTGTSITATLGVGMIGIEATDASGKSVFIVVYGAETGTYTGDNVIMGYYASATDDIGYTSFDSEATVTITDIDTTNHTLTGTFSFTGMGESDTDTMEFTSGQFTDITYTTDNVTGDEMAATVNGTAYDYKNSIGYVAYSSPSISFAAVGPDHWITINANETVSNGTYDLAAADSPFEITYKDATGTEYTVSEGTVGISGNTGGWLTGTFSFVVKNDAGETLYTVTSGSFNIDYNY
ncbi:DUF6252 family protein [Flavobacterium sp. RHBU_3]|uniref:DUF6252 family protein n=1 Tax=Flavobacterium sp. RHBU_3 TaxID=3391184 RepID=UPI0039853AFD